MPAAAHDDQELASRVQGHLAFLYPDRDSDQLTADVVAAFSGFRRPEVTGQGPFFSPQSTLLIAYGDSLTRDGERPLRTMNTFLQSETRDCFSAVHLLPFCPFSSDDGFAVVDYTRIDDRLGSWDDLAEFARHRRLMADLVINHVSAESVWFQNYLAGVDPGRDYFIEADPDEDLSHVTRPRTSPLLRPVQTTRGLRHVWCTFSHDQIDVNFRNPSVLLEFLKIIRLYLEHGVSLFRLDAVGFLWKEIGTTCMHLPQTHEIVRLIRSVTDVVAPGTVLITETNVPNQENLTYFGNRNEAHVIYNFSLAPLLVHSLLTGCTDYLKQWTMSMPPSPEGCAYLNFTASHDGIGMRPAEGLLSDEEQQQLTDAVRRFGGQLSTRRTDDGSERVYELNIALIDALQGTVAGPDGWQFERFLCSQTVMMGLEGIPAFYIHSLLATGNDLDGVRRTGRNRSINRHGWRWDELQRRLEDRTSLTRRVRDELLRRIAIRRVQPAFHPNATQFTLQLADCFFAFWRQSRDRSQSIFAVHNMTDVPRPLSLKELNLIALERWHDLISGEEFTDLFADVPLQPYQCLWVTNRIAEPR